MSANLDDVAGVVTGLAIAAFQARRWFGGLRGRDMRIEVTEPRALDPGLVEDGRELEALGFRHFGTQLETPSSGASLVSHAYALASEPIYANLQVSRSIGALAFLFTTFPDGAFALTGRYQRRHEVGDDFVIQGVVAPWPEVLAVHRANVAHLAAHGVPTAEPTAPARVAAARRFYDHPSHDRRATGMTIKDLGIAVGALFMAAFYAWRLLTR